MKHRYDVIIIGGGVIGDLAGFAAAVAYVGWLLARPVFGSHPPGFRALRLLAGAGAAWLVIGLWTAGRMDLRAERGAL